MKRTTTSAGLRLACPALSLAIAGLMPGIVLAENGCSDLWSDYRGAALVEIANDDPGNPFRYRPRCAMIVAGTVVRFRAIPEFGNHPLFAGTIENGKPVVDPDSPIGSITSGTEAERVLPEAGEFPYFCDFHYASGMQGSILVLPQVVFADGFDGD
jgi:plastocyanin